MSSDQYNTKGWSRIHALQAASFALTSNENHLNALLENFSCHQSCDRRFINLSVAIICPIIPFANENLQASVEENLRKRHGGDDAGVIIYLSTDGEDEQKQIWLEYIFKSGIIKSIKFLELLKSGNDISEDLFQQRFNEIKNHILFRILKHSYSYNNQINLFDDRKVQAKTLNSFQDNHPLNRNTFKFNFKNE